MYSCQCLYKYPLYNISLKKKKISEEIIRFNLTREGFDSSVNMPFSWCVVAVTLPIY